MGFQDILLDILALKRGARFVFVGCTYGVFVQRIKEGGCFQIIYVTHRYRLKQGWESEEHNGHDEVDQVIDGDSNQKRVKLSLELLVAKH